ncbi:MAG: phosphate ABC transporter permease subunit PstC, partial [Anaerolineales bacterium]
MFKNRKNLEKKIVISVIFFFALISVFTTFGIIGVLLQETILFFRQVSIVEFLTGTRWTPLFA